MIIDHRDITETRSAGSFSPFTLGIEIGKNVPEATVLHELIHFGDFVSTYWGQNVINSYDSLARTMSASFRSAASKSHRIVFPILTHDQQGTETILTQSREVLAMCSWLYGSDYRSLAHLKLSSAPDKSRSLVRSAAFSLNFKTLVESPLPHVSVPHLEGEDLNGSRFSFRPGMLHFLECRAQLANFHYLVESSPKDQLALASRMDLIFNEPAGFAYGALLTFGCQIWDKHVWNSDGPSLWFTLHPICLFAYAALIYFKDSEEQWGREIARGDLSTPRARSFATLVNEEHPFSVFVRICEAARQDWYGNDWNDFPKVWVWANRICKSATQLSLIEMIAKLRNGLTIGLESSTVANGRGTYPLNAGIKILELLEEDPQSIVSPQRLLKRFIGTDLFPCIRIGEDLGWHNLNAIRYTMEMSAFERALWGGRLHSGSTTEEACSKSVSERAVFARPAGAVGRGY